MSIFDIWFDSDVDDDDVDDDDQRSSFFGLHFKSTLASSHLWWPHSVDVVSRKFFIFQIIWVPKIYDERKENRFNKSLSNNYFEFETITLLAESNIFKILQLKIKERKINTFNNLWTDWGKFDWPFSLMSHNYINRLLTCSSWLFWLLFIHILSFQMYKK